jgi:manganese oxidase
MRTAARTARYARAGVRLALVAGTLAASPAAAQTCARTFVARVVALDQHVWYNRLGAQDPAGMMFALEQDVVGRNNTAPGAGNAVLRPEKRPRPLTLRVNAGSCLRILFKNWLSNPKQHDDQPSTRYASVHAIGMQLVSNISDDGSNVQKNTSSLVAPGGSATYTWYAEKEGTYLLYSTAATTGGEGDGGQIAKGLFGAVNVEPAGAEWYRSQLTQEELQAATTGTVSGYPQVNYDALYPTTFRLAQLRGRPILRMTKGDTIVHSDLTAIITGPNRGNFASGSFPDATIPVYPDRLKPFREFTVIFHDEPGLVQAFDSIFEAKQFEHTLHGGRDAFAINYGTGGIGAEILANRFRVGPMRNCNECKYEEFFLSSWAVGDPAMIVDVPAAADFRPSAPPTPGTARATKALYPADPSNVFHSYLNDHVKIRNLHAGPKEHHIFHLHAHQWLHTPNSAKSNYHDSQSIGPGAGYTYEITYGGSGNRNLTPGDAILHCHFYPHFAQGMWALWRVHDVFEAGTVMDINTGRPQAGARALPDGEITDGTPIPAVVPMPTYALAPNPTNTMPGFPFYIPGVAGHRPPRPPLDVQPDNTLPTGFRDGGLPRHVVTGGVSVFPALNTTNFEKKDSLLAVSWLPEGGTPAEQAAMTFHASAGTATPVAGSWTTTATFRTNGRAAAPGAPYADPCPANAPARTYKAAAFQVDTAYYNKARWNFDQHRMFGLWDDVNAFITGAKAPEPFFFRAHSNDCITYHLVNLVPEVYKLDDFQVKTPTDVIGQHIHLVKFDVTSSDGAANGFNYEDGSLAPVDVQHRIEAIRRQNGCAPNAPRSQACPLPFAHPVLGAGRNLDGDTLGDWVGAQETRQRWWVDPVLRDGGSSRLGTVFTHDHFGPSTHQQTGLYAGLLPEDAGTTWRDPETGTPLGGRADGGPTSWRADILYGGNESKNFREFALQIADFTLAYGKEGFAGTTSRRVPINPPGKFEVDTPDMIRPPLAGTCPNGIGTSCPEILSADDPGTMSVNYRNEPLALRVRTTGNAQAALDAGDLSRAFNSDGGRADTRLNGFGPYNQRPGVLATDPFTPLLRAYEDDRILVRLLVGAHEEGHNFSIHGTRWLFEPLDSNSGWRNSQMAGISEYHDFNLDPLFTNPNDTIADYMYMGGAATDDLWNGIWGIIRSYRKTQPNLAALYTGRGPSRSFEAAKQDKANNRKGQPDGWLPSFPDPWDDSTWEGSLSTLSTTTTQQSAAYYDATGRMVMLSDSVTEGYGTESTGGIEYDQFQYDADTGTETVVTGDPDAGSYGLAPSSTTPTPSYRDSLAVKEGTELRESTLYEGTTATPDGTSRMSATSSGTVYTYQGGGGNNRGFWGMCPRLAPIRFFDVTAVAAKDALPGGQIVYNTRQKRGGPLVDPSGILYVFSGDLDATGKLKANKPIEPIVLRANAGDCIMVRLRNRLTNGVIDPNGFNTLPIIVDRFNANHVDPSTRVGLHPQLVAYDVQRSDGSEVGINANTTVAPGRWRWLQWYAGDVRVWNRDLVGIPIEFGATNLIPSDRIKHPNKGAIGALVIEPMGSTHQDDPGTRASATIRRWTGSTFREFVLQYQDDINLRFSRDTTLRKYDCDAEDRSAEEESSCTLRGGFETYLAGRAVPNTAEAEDPEDSGQKAFNYRTEPLWFRMGFAPDAELGFTRTRDFRDVLKGDSAQTPLFKATPGQEIRFRVLQPGGHARNHVFNLHGHAWDELPYVFGSYFLGTNSESEVKGARDGHGPSAHHDILPKGGAGGRFRIPGDYLYRDQPSFQFDGGLWGVLRVGTQTTSSPTPTSPTPTGPYVGSGDIQSTSQQPAAGGCVIDPATGKTTCSR